MYNNELFVNIFMIIHYSMHTYNFRDVNSENLSGISILLLAIDFSSIILVIIAVRFPVT